MTDHYAVLGVKKSATGAEIHSAYRRMIKALHPDLPTGNATQFRAVTEAHEVLSDAGKRERYDRVGAAKPVLIQSKDHVYQLGSMLCAGDLADIHCATDDAGRDVVLKVARTGEVNDMLAHEVETLSAVAHPGNRYSQYLPVMLDSFIAMGTDRSRRQVNVFNRLDGWVTLESVRSRDPALRIEHATWMFNRLLELLGHVHREGYVHGAILPPHVMAFVSTDVDSEWDHGIKLIDWCCATKLGERLTTIFPSGRWAYPPEVFAKQPVTPATDIYMAAKCIAFVLGFDPASNVMPPHVPAYLGNFLRGCTLGNPAMRPQDAWTLLTEFKAFMREHYGRKKYVRFTLPPTN